MKQLSILFAILFSVQVSAQMFQPEWSVNMYGFADNREYNSSYQIPQSMLGVWLAPEVGLRFDSVHHVRVGVGLLREFGSPKEWLDQADYAAYYLYDAKPFKFYMGVFPGRELLADYPAVMLYDSISNYHQNLGGIYWSIYQNKWNFDLWLDWDGRQTSDNRERFIVGLKAKVQPNIFYASVQAYMRHYAGTTSGDDLYDNMMARVCAGISWGGNSILDSLNVNVGGVFGYSRHRAIDERHKPVGLLSEVTLEKFGIGVKNSFYTGDEQQAMYSKPDIGGKLYLGDPYYRNRTYNRTDFYINFIETGRVSARFVYSLHAAEKELSHQQQFFLLINLDSNKKDAYPKSNRRTLASWFKSVLSSD